MIQLSKKIISAFYLDLSNEFNYIRLNPDGIISTSNDAGDTNPDGVFGSSTPSLPKICERVK